MSGIYKEKESEQEEDGGFEAGFVVPDVSGVLQKLESARINALRQEHQQATEEEEKAGKNSGKDKKREVQRQGGTICCCYVVGCGIGPFVEKV